MFSMISSSERPRATWLEIWKKLPEASVPSPYRPRAVSPSFVIVWSTLLICFVRTSAGRCAITEARSPVPVFVGQQVRYPQSLE